MIDIEVKYSPSDARKRLGGEKFFLAKFDACNFLQGVIC